jgi:propanediol utilization protein
MLADTLTRKPHAPRFVRLSTGDVALLFGDEPLEPRFPISNGRFVARQRVALVGKKGRIDGVPVVGPPGEETSVSFGHGDQDRLDTADGGVIIVGPSGERKLSG